MIQTALGYYTRPRPPAGPTGAGPCHGTRADAAGPVPAAAQPEAAA